MKVELVLPPSKRDLRLDLFRGLANWAMFLGHISSPVLSWFSFRNYGFSDGADLFVFISGYTSALVFTRKMQERGFVFGATRLFGAPGRSMSPISCCSCSIWRPSTFLSYRFDTPDFIDRFNVAPLLVAPVETLTQGLVLKYKPVNLDVLPLYVVLMGVFPPVLWLMQRHGTGHAGSVTHLFRRPAIRVEPSLVSLGGLVFQSVRVAASVRVWRVAGARRSQYAAFPGPLANRSLAWPDLSGFCRRHDPRGAFPRTSRAVSPRVFEAFNPTTRPIWRPIGSCIWRSWSSRARG